MSEAWPATDLMLAAWGTSVCQKYAYSTFRLYIQGLKHYHVVTRESTKGFSTPWLRSMKTALRRMGRRKEKQKRWPIIIPHLRKIIKILNPDRPVDVLKGFIYLVGFFGRPRPSEYLYKKLPDSLLEGSDMGVHPTILWKDAKIQGNTPNRILTIKAHGAKFDPDDEGYFMGFRENNTILCVVSWFEKLRSIRNKRNQMYEYSPLMSLGESPVTTQQAKQWLRQDAKRAGLHAENYTQYSLRRGLATSLFLLGAPAETIKRLGRWRSDAYKRYIQLDTRIETTWQKRLLKYNLHEFGWLTLQEASQMKLSSVDEFTTTFRTSSRSSTKK